MEERLGEGAASIVYRAVHIGLERSFAIKLLKTAGPPSTAALEHFRSKAVALGRLRHPHIVEIIDFGIDGPEGGRPYIVTKLLKGRPLSDVCRDQGPLSLAQAVPLLEQIAAAVDAAHDAGVLHGDLKPGNAFVCAESPQSPSVKVLDFGLAELLAGPDKSSSGTLPGGEESPPGIITTGSLLGTSLYVSPELVRLDKASRSSDIYSFVVLAYEILSGKPWFRATLEEFLAGHLETELPPLHLPPGVWRALRKALQNDPAHRSGTASAIVHQFLIAMITAERVGENTLIGIPHPRHGTNRLSNHEPSDERPESIHAVLAGLEKQYRGQHLYPREFFTEHELRRRFARQDLGVWHALRGRMRDLASRIKALLNNLGLEKAGADLTGGTALLTYYVGESQSFLLVQWTPGLGLFFYPLAIGREELTREVEAFRNVWGGPDIDLSALKGRGRHLYDLLVRPAKRVLGTADCWVISPDGPLHSLPFATLFSGTQYLADSKPIYMAASNTSTEERRHLWERRYADLRAAKADREARQETSRIAGLLLPYHVQLTGNWNPQPRSRRSPPTLRKRTPFPPIKTERLVGEKYRLQEHLGEGAIGVVYRAVHVGLEKAFAIKILKTSEAPAPAALKRFRREALALGRLQHPHIVEVTDSGTDGSEGGLPYLVTELLEGMPLSDLCRDQGPWPLAQAFSLLGQIAAAVDAAHDAGVLHRDLKPGNVFVCSESPESPSVKVLDFGLAELLAGPDKSSSGVLPGGKESPPGLTATGSLLGTPLYLAPELVRLGQASRFSDIYSFGVLAYEILGGKPPFRGTVEEVLACHLEADPPPLPLPPELWRPLRETLQKDPALRPGTAGEVVRRFQEGIIEAERVCWRSDSPVPHISLPVRAEAFRKLNLGIRKALQGQRDQEPRSEALLSPFLGLKEARAHLAPGTALLNYFVDESQSFLFVIEAKEVPGVGLFLYPLAIGRAELSREVEAFRNVWRRPGTDLSALKERGRHLYDLLVRPAEAVLGKADRWLISPDESLHSLPFATLFSGIHYLADSKPIYIAASYISAEDQTNDLMERFRREARTRTRRVGRPRPT